MENYNLINAEEIDISPIFQEYEQILVATLADLEKHCAKLLEKPESEFTKKDISNLDYLNYMLADFRQGKEYLRIEELLVYVRDYCKEQWNLRFEEVKQYGNSIMCIDKKFPIPEALVSLYQQIDQFSEKNYPVIHQKFQDFILEGHRVGKDW